MAGAQVFFMTNAYKVGHPAIVVVLAAILAISVTSCQAGSSAPTPTLSVATTVEPSATPVPHSIRRIRSTRAGTR